MTLLIALGIVFAVAAVVAIVLLGAFIVLLPVVLISTLLFYLFPGLRPRRPGHKERKRTSSRANIALSTRASSTATFRRTIAGNAV